MPTQEKAIEELGALSGQVSERTRTIAGGIIAIWWALLVGDSSDRLSDKLQAALIAPVVLAGSALLFDFLQYLSGYLMTLKAFRAAEKLNQPNATPPVKPDVRYDPNHLLFQFRTALFFAKLIAAALAMGWLLVSLWYALR
jgi:hypothetical protein